MTDDLEEATDQTLHLGGKRALLPPVGHICEATLGWNGMLAWASCTFMIFVFGITLVKLLVPGSGRAFKTMLRCEPCCPVAEQQYKCDLW